MGVHHVFVVAGLAVAAALPTTRVVPTPTPAPIEAVVVTRPETKAPDRAPKRRARPRIAVVAAKPMMSLDHGGAAWWLDELPRIEHAFHSAFGRPLPISAFGQTALHDRLGFDHRDAVDVALHADSREGIALQGFLRDAGIPFIVARGSVRGVSTGAHIHIGPPSHRFTTLALSTP